MEVSLAQRTERRSPLFQGRKDGLPARTQIPHLPAHRCKQLLGAGHHWGGRGRCRGQESSPGPPGPTEPDGADTGDHRSAHQPRPGPAQT